MKKNIKKFITKSSFLLAITLFSCNDTPPKLEDESDDKSPNIYLDYFTVRKISGDIVKSDSIYWGELNLIVSDSLFSYPCAKDKLVTNVLGYEVSFERIRKPKDQERGTRYSQLTTFEASIYANSSSINFSQFTEDVKKIAKSSSFTFLDCSEEIKIDSIVNSEPIILGSNDSGL